MRIVPQSCGKPSPAVSSANARLESTPATLSRRAFLASTVAVVACGCSATGGSEPTTPPGPEPVIDVHQHLPFQGRTGAELLTHQERMGVTHTVLLPSGSPVVRPSTHMGKSNGLLVGVGPNRTAAAFARRHPGRVWFFANEVPDLPGARDEIEKYLKQGAIGIGEVKFNLACDSVHMEQIAALAGEYQVPVLMHFSREGYNSGFDRFHKMLEKFPRVIFIGHARTFWANVDKDCDQITDYPKTPVTPGGITDRYLSDYPNMYGDISAGSGLNSMMRDEGHARWFLNKHQDKIMFGSDCGDKLARAPDCDGAPILAALRRLCPTKAAERKILYENAKRVLRL